MKALFAAVLDHRQKLSLTDEGLAIMFPTLSRPIGHAVVVRAQIGAATRKTATG